MLNDIVYGPIHSRRLGASLGVNLLPSMGKVCNFDCVYCECGYNVDNVTTEKMPDTQSVILALAEKLKRLKSENVLLDSITFSGNGEPTLHKDFKNIIIETCKLRETFYPKVAISVLTNGTNVGKTDVFEGLMLADNAIVKLDSAFEKTAQLIDDPKIPYSVKSQVELYKKFNGKFILQTMFLRGTVGINFIDNSSEVEVAAWLEIVKILKPRCVTIYTLDRETPCKSLEKIDAKKLKDIGKRAEALGIKTIIAE